MRFKVGDVVECKVAGQYAITDVGVPCRVVSVNESDLMRVAVINSDNSTTFIVNQLYFKKLSSSASIEVMNPFKSVTINEAKRKVTVVYGKNDYQIATCSENDTFDPAVGIALAMAYKAFGSKTKFHKFVKSLTDKK